MKKMINDLFAAVTFRFSRFLRITYFLPASNLDRYDCLVRLQKKETFLKPMVDVIVKEGKDKFAKFECVFSRSKMRPKWTHKRDVSIPYFGN